MLRFAVIAAALLLSAGEAFAHGEEPAPPPKKEAPMFPVKVVQSRKGRIFVDNNGMTLYTFDRDTSGDKSTCDGKCTERWRPLTAAGDVNGFDGANLWHVARPAF